MTKQNIWFILGLSGSGKTHFCEWIANKKNWLHMNLDQSQKIFGYIYREGMEIHDLKTSWKIFEEQKNFQPLVNNITKQYTLKNKSGAILSFPSNRIIKLDDIKQLGEKIKTIYLYSNKDNCLNSYLSRERTSPNPQVPKGKDLTTYWHKYNKDILEYINTQELNNYKVDTFYKTSERKSPETIYEEIG